MHRAIWAIYVEHILNGTLQIVSKRHLNANCCPLLNAYALKRSISCCVNHKHIHIAFHVLTRGK